MSHQAEANLFIKRENAMIPVEKRLLRKLQTAAWTNFNFPQMYDDRRMMRDEIMIGVITRINSGLEINVKGYEVFISVHSLLLGVIKVEGLEYIKDQEAIRQIWEIIAEIKREIFKTQIG